MPVTLQWKVSNLDGSARSSLSYSRSSRTRLSPEPLRIALVNNMPDGALEATERQFLSLLNAASSDCEIELSLYALPGIARGADVAKHVAHLYSGTEELETRPPDAMIVTGREPLTENLADEPYWKSFTRLLEFARTHTLSTVWSCLGAHAAVLAMDNISRMRMTQKCSGVLQCERVGEHALLAGAPEGWRMPHSRWNGLPEDRLRENGYRILTRSPDFGVDTFVKEENSLLLFFQGHPEYEANTLLLEYRRDVARYLRGELAAYPTVPTGYCDAQTEARLLTLERECATGNAGHLGKVLNVLGDAAIESTWRANAIGIYRKWLNYLAARRTFANDAKVSPAERRAGKRVVNTVTPRSEPSIAELPA